MAASRDLTREEQVIINDFKIAILNNQPAELHHYFTDHPNLKALVDKTHFKAITAAIESNCYEVFVTLCELAPEWINQSNHDAWTPLMSTAFYPQLDKFAHHLLAFGASQDVTIHLPNNLPGKHFSIHGYRALELAIAKENDRVAILLSGHRAIHRAAMNDNCDVLRTLLAQSPEELEALDHCGHTPLAVAVKYGSINSLRLLLSLNANTQQATLLVSYQGKSVIRIPLLHAAIINQHALTVYALLATGCDILARGEDGMTAIHYAVHSTVEIMKAVLENLPHKDIVDSLDNNQTTALALAVMHRKIEMVKLLLKAGANHQERITCSVHDRSLTNYSLVLLAAALGERNIFDALHQAGADLQAVTEPHKLPLMHIAAANGHSQFIRYFLYLGLSNQVTQVDAKGNTAFHYLLNNLSSKGNDMLAIARLFIEHGASTDTQDALGNTLSHILTTFPSHPTIHIFASWYNQTHPKLDIANHCGETVPQLKSTRDDMWKACELMGRLTHKTVTLLFQQNLLNRIMRCDLLMPAGIEVFYLAVILIDKHLLSTSPHIKERILLALTAFSIAHKTLVDFGDNNFTHPFIANDICSYLALQSAYNPKDIMKAELMLLRSIDYNVSILEADLLARYEEITKRLERRELGYPIGQTFLAPPNTNPTPAEGLRMPRVNLWKR